MNDRRRAVDTELRTWMASRFDGLDSRVDRLADQVTATNGRLRDAENHIAACSPVVAGLRERVKEPTGQNRRIQVWDVVLVCSGVTAAISVMKWLGLLRP